jgi:mono/diheme cytochrome c family protein
MTMWRQKIGSIAVVLLLAGLYPLFCSAELAPSAIASSDAELIARGERLFAQNCSPCHGQKAVGENPATPLGGWNKAGPIAPALNGTGHAWHHPPRYFFHTIRNGSSMRGTRMIGWVGRMSDAEIVAVIAYFQSLWPQHIKDAYRQRFLHRVEGMK